MRISDWSSDVCSSDLGAQALEMTKWFDTNYHFMVPEFTHGQAFALASTKPVDEYREAKALGYRTRPVLLGPVTYRKLDKSQDPPLDPLSLLAGRSEARRVGKECGHTGESRGVRCHYTNKHR